MAMDAILCTSVNEAEKYGHMEQDLIKVSCFATEGIGFETFPGLPSPSLTFIIVFLSFPRPSNLSRHPLFTRFSSTMQDHRIV